jgi:hypothetical protein
MTAPPIPLPRRLDEIRPPSLDRDIPTMLRVRTTDSEIAFLRRAFVAGGLVTIALLVGACAPTRPPARTGMPTGYDRLEEDDLSADDFETAPEVFDPAGIVPPDLLAGPHHRVTAVRLDHRFLYTYVVEADQDTFEVVGRGLLRERVIEEEVLAALPSNWLGGTKLYAFEVVNAASDPIEDTLQILRHPIRTVVNVPKGINASFQALREMTAMRRTYLEDDYYKEFIGLGEQKREWAERLGVDPYSTNPRVQARLTRNGWLSLAGDLTVSLATLPVPAGGATIAMSVVGATSGMNEQLRDVAPEDVRVSTRAWIRRELDVDDELAERFLAHPWYSPSRQETIVRALSRMDEAAHRDRFLALAAQADEAHEAYAFTRLALMLAECDEQRSPIRDLFISGDLVMARTADDEVVLPLYMDQVYWTAGVARAEAEIASTLDGGPGGSRRLLLVSGGMSARAHQELAARGWEVIEGLEDLWLTPLDLARLKPANPNGGRILPELGH